MLFCAMGRQRLGSRVSVPTVLLGNTKTTKIRGKSNSGAFFLLYLIVFKPYFFFALFYYVITKKALHYALPIM